MKNFLFLKLLALVVCLSSSLSATAQWTAKYDFKVDGIYYKITSSTNKTVGVSQKYDAFDISGDYSGSVTIPSSVYYNGITYQVTSIEDYAFYWCPELTSVNTGSGVRTIGKEAFQRCESLTDITLGSSVTSIGAYAFDLQGTYTVNGTTYLNEVTFHCKSITPPTLASNSFVYNSDVYLNPYNRYRIYTVNPYSRSLYKAATYWSNFHCLQGTTYDYYVDHRYDFYTGGIYYLISGTNTVKVCNKYGEGSRSWYGLGDYSYRGSVTIPTTAYYSGTSKTYNVTAIANNAFDETPTIMINGSETPSLRNQGDLTSVVVGSNVTTIGENAFKNCTGLTSVTLGTGVTSIGGYAFNGCTALTTVNSNRSTPPTIQSTTFDNSHYSTVTLKVPSTSAVNSYKAATYWKNFYLIVPNGGELNYALNVSGGNINFTSTGTYPWIVKGDGTRIYAQSSNGGVTSSTSTMSASVSLSKPHTVTFDFKAWGEGTSYDVCIFSIDGVEQFKYGARQNDWESYSAAIPAGSHTLTWSYQKDGSVNPTGDYFAVDNVKLTEVTIQPGDVNGDGNVNISDVTTLIDILLAGGTPPAGADVNGDGQVNIADVTALIDMLLGS